VSATGAIDSASGLDLILDGLVAAARQVPGDADKF
jgi:hypothetical protein